jgi:hypothetical protein
MEARSMENLRWWLLLIAAVMFSMSGCVSARDWADWVEHPTHFASTDHLAFSVRASHAEVDGPQPIIRDEDIQLAQDEAWWGHLVPPAPPTDLSSRWVGTWKGLGLFDSLRQAPAEATLVQQGSIGVAHLHLNETIAAGLPWLVRLQGSRGVRLVYRVSGSEAWMRHPEARSEPTVAFTLIDERLVGTLRGIESPVVITLTRQP